MVTEDNTTTTAAKSGPDAHSPGDTASQHLVEIEMSREDQHDSDQQTQPAADQQLSLRVEALLLSTERPLSDGKLADLLEVSLDDGGSAAVRKAIDELNAAYEDSGRSFRIEAVAGGRQILTLPAFGPVLHRLHQAKMQTRLSPAALETLAIVAYRQPVLRADIEAIRGVASGEVLRGLMERRMVKIVGRAEEIGRPILYGTTRGFLRTFGLSNLDDLPQAKELREPSNKPARKKKEQRESDHEAASESDASSCTAASIRKDGAGGEPSSDAD